MTMEAEFNKLIEQYVSWLRDKTLVKKVSSEWVEITTPFLDRHNDYLQIYAKKEGDAFRLTDDSSTISDLKISGCDIGTPKRKKLLQQTLNGFGVGLVGDALTVTASASDFAQKKHDLIQAVLAVNDLFYLAETTVASLFFEDVGKWFDDNNIRYSPRVRFSGKTGFVHSFDFVIPKSNRMPERIVQLMNKPHRSTAEKVAFSWVDTKEGRSAGTKAYAFLNDKAPIQGIDEVAAALSQYDISPVRWSQRDQVVQDLSA